MRAVPLDRERDRAFARVLFAEDVPDPRTFIERIRALPEARAQQERLAKWVSVTERELQ